MRSYSKDRSSEATLLRGRIELTLLKNPDRKYILKPSEKITINNGPLKTAALKKAPNDTGDFSTVELSRVPPPKIDGLPAEVLWTKSMIDFDNTDFEAIAGMMEHKYNVSIIFKNDDVKKLKFTGKFTNESVEQAMQELRATVIFHDRINDDEITIY